jgi:hypothetical protein
VAQTQDPWADIHERDKRDYIFKILEGQDELVEWFLTYLDLDLTTQITDDASNSSPADAAWKIYQAVRDNKGDELNGFILLSSRDSYKTLTASALEYLILTHFQTTIAHMAAIKDQSAKAISYINVFVNKTEKYLSYHGWVKISSSKSLIQFRTPAGDEPYIKVIICTMAGANSEHTQLMFIDEIDVVRDPVAYEESKAIPGVDRGKYPLTVKLSTRKFAFGLMQKELDNAKEADEIVLQWNLLDVTERCPPERYAPKKGNKTTQTRYAANELPLRHIAPEEWETLPEFQKPDWEKVEAYDGCMKCKLFPVCKGKLAKKDPKAVGGLYKPIPAVIKSFQRINPDMAQAQLLCRKPSSKGLLYGRFEERLTQPPERRNVISIEEAYEQLMGVPMTKIKGNSEHDKTVKERQMEVLREAIYQLNLPVYAGLDWGYTKEFAIVVGVQIPNGDFWIVETFGESDLELDDQLKVGQALNERWHIRQWFADTAYPGSIRKFDTNGLKCAEFTKDVLGGIEAIRGQIVDSSNRRKLKVIDWDKNAKFRQMVKVHHFKLDMAGRVTETPDDEEYSDVGDATRYLGQNLFSLRTGKKPMTAGGRKNAPPGSRKPIVSSSQPVQDANTKLMQEEIRRRAILQSNKPEGSDDSSKPSKNKKVFWNLK